jgi:hypothetical protein
MPQVSKKVTKATSTRKRGRPRKETSGGGPIITTTTRTTKRFVDLKRTPADKKKLAEDKPKRIEESYVNSTANNHYSPVYINNHYHQKRKPISKPEDPNHWTLNRNHTNWVHLWHLQEQIIELRRKFFTQLDWSLFSIISSLEESYIELLTTGDLTRNYNIQTLINFYVTHTPNELKSDLNQYTPTFYTHPQNYRFPPDTFAQAFYNPTPKPPSVSSKEEGEITSDSEYIDQLRDEIRPTITYNTNNTRTIQRCNPISGNLV